MKNNTRTKYKKPIDKFKGLKNRPKVQWKELCKRRKIKLNIMILMS